MRLSASSRAVISFDLHIPPTAKQRVNTGKLGLTDPYHVILTGTLDIIQRLRITALSFWNIPFSHKTAITSSSAMTPKRRPSKTSNKPDELSPMVSTRPTPHPHRDPHDKLIKRFYEPLVLQHVLGSTRGDHIPRLPPDVQDAEEMDSISLRRDFLDKLAFVCDYEKGGATVTAIALQQTPAAVIFWVAANEGVGSQVKPFLETILSSLEKLHSKPAESVIKEAEDKIFQCAVEFGKLRIKAYLKCMKERLDKCHKIIAMSNSHADQGKRSVIYLKNAKSPQPHQDLMKWLTSFRPQDNDLVHLCRFAYEERQSPHMKELATRSHSKYAGNVDSSANNFAQLRHYIGRIGSYMRASKIFVAAAGRFPELFVNVEVQCLSSPEPVPKPQMDKLMTLDKIAVRMLPADDKRLSDIQNALQSMDKKFEIFKRFKDRYEDDNFRPRVHAELILLERFYVHEYPFVDGDRYIGCSKPACYCCYLYICAHPGGFVKPPSHSKNYLNWSPPEIDPVGSVDLAIHRRDMLNSMCKEIRGDVLRQIQEQRPQRDAHHDSTTGITRI